MTFISIEYIVFCLVVIPLYFALKLRWRRLLILTASYFFYGYWNASYIILIVFTTLVDYTAGLSIGAAAENQNRRKLFLGLSLTVNLGVLFIMNYNPQQAAGYLKQTRLLGVKSVVLSILSLFLDIFFSIVSSLACWPTDAI